MEPRLKRLEWKRKTDWRVNIGLDFIGLDYKSNVKGGERDMRRGLRHCQEAEISWRGESQYCSLNTRNAGFPGFSVVKNPRADAGGTGLYPDPGSSHMPPSKEAHAPQMLSLCSGAHGLQWLKAPCLELVLPSKRSQHNVQPTHRSWRVAPALHNKGKA